MTKALLVVGAGIRFFEEARQMQAFLRDRAELSEVKLCLPAYLSEEQLEKIIAGFIRCASSEDTLLIGYFGHGNAQGWAYSSDGECLPFQFLVDVIRRVDKKVLVVNGCCHSYELARLMVEGGVSSERCGVIAAGHGVTSNNLSKALISVWSRHESYQPQDCTEKIVVTFEFPKSPWKKRLKEWWLRNYTEIMNGILPRRFPVIYGGYIGNLGITRETLVKSKPYEPDDPSNPFPVRWGAMLDPLFFGKG